ncbi:MAG: tripartite tricarboxylate transporter permease [Candidatus Aenigmarchaeota archaeon]|nr:tripartite tricarboxylate transporter permease [Candidatus Aenigmarchaeota archaeon]
MFFEILVFIALGVVAGVVAGLLPGIHPNTIIVLMLGALPFLSAYPLHAIIAFIISMVVVNTIVNFIPSVFLGAPEDDTALGVLPGHRLLLEGKGLEAVYLSVVGGIGVVLLFVLTLPVLVKVLPYAYGIIKNYIHFILLAVVTVMIATEKGVQKFWGLVVFVLSGILGIVVLNSYLVQPDYVFFPLFSGLFGISTLLISLNDKTRLVAQIKNFGVVEKSVAIIGSIKGFFSGLIVGILPGMGSAQAGTLVQIITRKRDDKEYLVSLGGINTANALFALAALYTIGKTRSGAAAAVEKLVESFGFNELLLLTGVALLSAGMGAIVTLFLSKRCLFLIERLPYDKLSIAVIATLIVLTIIFAGLYGILILAVSTAIGLIAPLTKVKRSLLMGVLILPVVLWFFGLI